MAKKTVTEIFSHYQEQLLKFVRSRTRLVEDAEDIVQDVFYQFSRVSALAQPIEQTAAWLYRSVRNRIIDKSRKKKEEPLPSVYNEESGEYIIEEIVDIVYNEEATPETAYLRSLILDEIKNALAQLPKEQRTVFELTEIAGLSVKEVAEKTAVPVSTVLSRKHYAVKRLRKQLAELYSDVMGAPSGF